MTRERLYYLDWLRIGAFSLLILFHCFRFFDFFPWHIKNEQQNEWFTQFVIFTTSWRMPLIFFVSGAGTYFAMRSRGDGFSSDRIRRLVIPYLFGIAVLIPPQKYYEYLHNGGDVMTYLSFLVTYPVRLVEPDLGLNLVWLGHAGYHIWYLAYLFVITMLLRPVLDRLMSARPKIPFLDRRPVNLFWLFLPLLAINLAVRPAFPDYLHWADFFHYTYFFLLGFVFTVYRAQLTAWITANLKALLLIALLSSAATHYFALFSELVVRWLGSPGYSADYLAFTAIRTINALAWVLVLLGLAIRFLNRDHGYRYALNEAILPVYILHQTIIVALGFFIVELPLSIAAKATLILLASTSLMAAGYVLIEHIPAMRFLFGMKPA